jgi:hypothetical protein
MCEYSYELYVCVRERETDRERERACNSMFKIK